MTFAAEAFSPALPEGRVSGQVQVDDRTVRIEHPKGTVELPRAGLTLRIDGNARLHVYLGHPDHPGVAIVTRDLAILDHPVLMEDAAWRAARTENDGRLRREKRRTVGCLIAGLALLASVFLGVWMLGGRLLGWVVDLVPIELEVEAGERFVDHLEATGALIDDPEAEAALETLVAPLRAATSHEPYPFQVHLAADDSLNAFAFPGGPMVLHRGLILAADDAAEILGVLAHERAHVVARHTTRGLVRQAGLWVTVQILLGDATGIAGTIAEGGRALVGKAYSRDLEYEADAIGWQLLIDAGLDPRGLARFLEDLAAQEGIDGRGIPTFLSSHPASDDRIASLEARSPSGSFESSETLDEALATLQRHLATAD